MPRIDALRPSGLQPREGIEQRQGHLEEMTGLDLAAIGYLPFTDDQLARLERENLIGTLPLPLKISHHSIVVKSDVFADGQKEILVPIVTNEEAVLASLDRGLNLLNQAIYLNVLVEYNGMTRAPGFICPTGQVALDFSKWIDANVEEVARACEASSSVLKYMSHQSFVEGRRVFVRFAFDCDQAMGMNMANKAVKRMWQEIKKYHPDVRMFTVSANLGTDKKPSGINTILKRGYWVQAEAILGLDTIRSILKVEPEKLVQLHIGKNLIGSGIAGASRNMHAANTAQALALATGQDIAHLVEASQAATTIEMVQLETDDGLKDALYTAVTIPSLPLGVIGGATTFSTAEALRRIIGMGEDLTANQLAAVFGTAVLATEANGNAALANGELTQAHIKLGRSQ